MNSMFTSNPKYSNDYQGSSLQKHLCILFVDYIRLLLVPEIYLRFFQQKYNTILENTKKIINITEKSGILYVDSDDKGSHILRIATDDELFEAFFEEYPDSDLEEDLQTLNVHFFK